MLPEGYATEAPTATLGHGVQTARAPGTAAGTTPRTNACWLTFPSSHLPSCPVGLLLSQLILQAELLPMLLLSAVRRCGLWTWPRGRRRVASSLSWLSVALPCPKGCCFLPPQGNMPEARLGCRHAHDRLPLAVVLQTRDAFLCSQFLSKALMFPSLI